MIRLVFVLEFFSTQTLYISLPQVSTAGVGDAGKEQENWKKEEHHYENNTKPNRKLIRSNYNSIYCPINH